MPAVEEDRARLKGRATGSASRVGFSNSMAVVVRAQTGLRVLFLVSVGREGQSGEG